MNKTIIQTWVMLFVLALAGLTMSCGQFGEKEYSPLRFDTVITFAELPNYLDQQRGKGDLYFMISDPSNTKVSSVGDLLKNSSAKIHLSLKPSEEFNMIKDEAFVGCKNLTEVYIPQGVSTLGSKAFCKCPSLKAVHLPNSLTTIMDGVFYEDSLLVEVSIPDNVIVLGDSSFLKTAITSIDIPNGVKRIEEYTFAGCKNLGTVSIPNSVSYIGEGAFILTAIKSIFLSAKHIDKVAFASCKNLQEVVVEGSVDEIGEYAFADTKIGKLTFNNRVIGKKSFCQSTINTLNISNSVREIKEEAFFSCKGLAELTIPSTIESLEKGAFGIANIDKVTLNNKVIGEGAFKYSSIKTLIISSNVKEIKGEAFYGNKGVKETTVPSNVETIGKDAFNGTELERVTIGANKICEGAFAFCSNLKEVDLEFSVMNVERNAFYLCNNLRALSFDGKNDYLKNGIVDVYSNKLIIYVNDRYYYDYDRKYKGRYTFRTK